MCVCVCVFQDSSSVMEWDQCSGERSHQLLESQQSYETEWDMVNAVSFKKKTCTNGEGERPSSASVAASELPAAAREVMMSFHTFIVPHVKLVEVADGSQTSFQCCSK